MECFAFGGATVRFASLETSFHAANHTIPPPPSHEGHPHCAKDKNRSPFHGEKPLMIKWFLEKRLYQSPKTILHGRDATLRVRTKWLIFNIVSQLWADVKYHVPTGIGFSPKASGFYPFDDATDLERGRRWWCGVADSSLSLKSDIPQHQRQVRSTGIVKRLFFMFLFLCPSIFPLHQK